MDKETNRERFVRIAENRTQKIIDTLELLGNCSNTYNYEYTKQDIEKMFNAIETAVRSCKAKYNGSASKANRFTFD